MSNNIRIAILGYRDFIDLTKGIIDTNRHQVTINIYQCLLQECLPILPHLEESRTDIIITGRANQTFLEGRTSIPIITFRITPFDVLKAVKKALNHSRRIAIALANFEALEHDYSILEQILDIQLTYLSYSSQDELRGKIKDFSEEHGVVIGTSVAVSAAKEFQLPGILIYTLENSINESIERAIEMIRFKETEEKNSKQFKTILDSVTDGIIATNEKNEVTLINQSGWEHLQLPAQPYAGIPLSTLLDEKIANELSKLEDFQDKITKIGNRTLNVSRVSIDVRGKNAGHVITLQDLTQIQKVEQKYRMETVAKGMVAKIQLEDIVYSHPVMQKTIQRAGKFAQTESTILIIGETGTGKELFAQGIHNASKRRHFPFVAINCGALPETLLESELFGYEDGAFTGASKNGKKGLFEIAHNGTIFLDEINSISLASQARLLRVLQEREVVRIGSDRVIPINVRVIAASNEDLISLVQESKFRTDLYYRLNVLRLVLPPLRNRTSDLLPLSKQFIFNQNQELFKRLDPYFPEIIMELNHYPFPGNVRQLHNILERFLVLFEMEPELHLPHLKALLRECLDDQYHEISEKISFSIRDSYKDSLFEAERSLLLKYLELSNGDKASLATQLGIGKTTLYRKMKELSIDL